MKTHSIAWPHGNLSQNSAILESASKLNRILHLAAKGFVALVPALAIVVGAAWVITDPGLELFLQATMWTSGFVFLALALESDGATVWLSLATAIVLPALTILSDRVASEFIIVAAALVATWVAAAILRR